LDIWYPNPQEKIELKNILAQARDHCGHLHEWSNKVERRMYQRVAGLLETKLENVYFMFQPEIIAALKGEELENDKLQLRRQKCLLMNYRGKLTIFEGADCAQTLKKLNIPRAGKIPKKILKGFSAYPGKVVGQARIIIYDRDFSKFRSGEILISLQTMVHYLPLMKRAKAILTEFGGITSHAAIVSRELKKPCVVGVKNLVVSFKDGDLVEVDANKGVVKKRFEN
jgi:phosphohistidine swiveling domain-containing protein